MDVDFEEVVVLVEVAVYARRAKRVSDFRGAQVRAGDHVSFDGELQLDHRTEDEVRRAR